MTREEAIKRLSDIRADYSCFDDDERPKYHALSMAIEALQDDWIPVSERLPEEYGQYLCYCEGGYCYVYWLENKPWAETTVKEEEIIAWMPLPEIYRPEGEDK